MKLKDKRGNLVSQTVSTVYLESRSWLEFWQAQMGELVKQVDCSGCAAGNFFGSITTHASNPTSLLTIRADPHTIEWHKTRLAPASDARILICIQTEGEAIVEQDGRESLLNVGDMTFLDLSNPLRTEYRQSMGQTVFQIPRNLIRKQFGTTERLNATVVRSNSPLAIMTKDFSNSLAGNFQRLGTQMRRRLIEQATEMAMMAFQSAAQADCPQVQSNSSGRSALGYRGRAYIELNLRDPSLSVSDVADNLQISTRYLSTVFAAEGLSVERFIWQRRLEQCARDLKNSNQASRSIGDIAFSWGFQHLAHFSQSFKAAFGQSPREFRKGTLDEFCDFRQ